MAPALMWAFLAGADLGLAALVVRVVGASVEIVPPPSLSSPSEDCGNPNPIASGHVVEVQLDHRHYNLP
jgi:hypothetical protein